MKKLIAIYDSDALYCTRFMEYFKKKKNGEFEIAAFTKLESLDEFIAMHQVEILLIGGQNSFEEPASKEIRYIYYFTDESGIKDEEKNCIYRYQPVQAVMNDILNHYYRQESVNQASSHGRAVKIVSVFSPIPGVDKLSFSCSLASRISEQKKTLLVILDILPLDIKSINDNQSSLSEYIYYIKAGTSNISKLNAMLKRHNNLSYLSGITHGMDIMSLNKEDINRWIEELRSVSDYPIVFFYLGGYTEAAIEIMHLSDTVLLPMKDHAFETTTLKEWKRQTDYIGYTEDHKYLYIQIQNENEDFEYIPQDFIGLTGKYTKSELDEYLSYIELGG